ncbi:putative cation transporter HKT6 [Canna indica]|uniref:Cation transporter HKT6 n=1 Tax=Canna indica TaxID=4628 RepID=A0AAQ3QRN7_9LILI|nr:putative cation transporter HKT6 [Canna indica]
MATVEMEDFSESQLWVLIILMLCGGEVFTSVAGLPFTKARLEREGSTADAIIDIGTLPTANMDERNRLRLKFDAIRYLGYAVLGYIFVINLSGFLSIFLYLCVVADARDVLRKKGLGIGLFSIFLSVSSFANCGFTPANENMMIFKKYSTLLLLIVPQILSGNTLFPACLRLVIRCLGKMSGREEFEYILGHSEAIRYKHLLPPARCVYLALTVVAFILVQFLLLCYQEWNSEVFRGTSSYQRAAAALFQAVNSRHAGESVLDVSKLSPAFLVVCVVMMYLPPYTYLVPGERDGWPASMETKERRFLWSLNLSLLCYPVIFIIIIALITERKSLLADPLNFNIFSVGFEVVSAYGNVGFSLGYSCSRLLKPDSYCKDASYGFVGRWSNKGKLIVIAVMLLGRLKKFQMKGGKAWKFS